MAQLISRGATGPIVRELQGGLRANGVATRIDGVFGVDTDRAVRAFQANRRLRVDGVAGPATFRALHGVAASRPAPVADRHDPWDLERWFRQMFGAANGPATPAAAAAPRTPRAVPKAATEVPAIVSPTENRNYRRLSIAGYEGRAWVLKDFEKYAGYQIQLLPTKVIRQMAVAPALRNECAQFVQFFGIPNTRSWRRGPQVCHLKADDIPVGTVIATLRDGKYYSDYSGRSHVGVYLGHDDYEGWKASGNATAGVSIMDQWNGAPIQKRKKIYAEDANAIKGASKKAWTDSSGRRQTRRVNWTRDGEEYFVLMTGA